MDRSFTRRPDAALILHGCVAPTARADEQDVLVQSRVVSDALQRLGYRPQAVSLTLDMAEAAERIRRIAPRFAFNLVESIDGVDRLLYLGTTLLDWLELPYTGSSTAATFLTSNKLLAKQTLRQAGLPTPAWAAVEDCARGEVGFPPPYIVKSVWDSASYGLVDVFDDEAALRHGLRSAPERGSGRSARLDSAERFVEAYVEGREFNVSMIAENGGRLADRPPPRPLPPAEMVFLDYPPGKPRIVGYPAKWDAGSFEYRHTVRRFEIPARDTALVGELEAMAKSCWELFGLSGYARVDFRVDRHGKPWILEVNVNPCLSPDAGFAAAAARAGMDTEAVVERIVADALGRSSLRAGSAAAGDPPAAPATRTSILSAPILSPPILSLREEVLPEDADLVRGIVESTGFFSSEEAEMAVSLVRERLDRGAASGYHFLFAAAAGFGDPPIAYSCYGPISCTRSACDLYWIAVRGEHRGRGIGTSLLAATEDRIRASGGRRVYVETSSQAAYAASRAFYEKSGYRREALLRDFYSPGDHKLIYVKEMP